MHDCRQTQDNLVDLLFGELDFATRDRLRAEVEACANCGAQYHSFAATLHACDEVAAALTPPASYWPQYHDALSRRLECAAEEATAEERLTAGRVTFRRRLFWTASIRVPAPLAAAAALLLIASGVFSLTLLLARPSDPIMLAAPASAPEPDAPHIKLIEVPVVREKIVTQIVYVPRRAMSGEGGVGADRSRRRAPLRNLAEVPPATEPSSPATTKTTSSRANLTGFKPVGEMNLRIIKEGSAREQ